LALATTASVAQTASAPSDTATWDVTRTRGQTRTIDFTATEGTFESVDISPDGQWVVFDLLGHIYRVPSSGGPAVCLTQNSGAALNYHPRYSPDGSRIAFVSDRRGQDNLWVMHADGSDPRPLFLDHNSRVRQPAWMPDGKTIVAVRVFPTVLDWELHRTTLAAFPASGGPPREVLSSSESQYYWPSPSPDGRYLYFYRSSILRDGDGVTTGQALQRLELATGRVRDLSPPSRSHLYRGDDVVEFAPEVSPDGEWLAFGRRLPGGAMDIHGHRYDVRTALWLRNLQTGAEHIAMDPIESDATQGNAVRHMKVIPGYRWAKDGRSIVIPQGGKLRRLFVETGAVVTIPFAAHVHREISESVRSQIRLSDDPFEAHFIRWPASSSDGKHLVFEAVGRLWTVDLPRGEPTPLTRPPDLRRGGGGDTTEGHDRAFEMAPAWSPDGQWVAYTTWDDYARGAVWKVPAGGGTPVRLTEEPGEYHRPAWSADGQWIVVAQGTGATARGEPWEANQWWQLARLPSTGGRPTVLTETDDLVGASVIADGRIFFPERQAEGDLWAAARHGETPQGRWWLRTAQQLVGGRLVSRGTATTAGADRAAYDLPGEDPVVSPDGRWIAFVHHFDLYVVPSAAAVRGSGALRITAADRRVRRLTWQGGLYPRWRDAHVLEAVSGNRYYVFDIATGRSDTLRIHLRIPSQTPRGTIALTGARIITLDQRRVIERGTVIVHGSRIACVGDGTACDTTGVGQVVDLTGKTIMPGLVDVHAHHLTGLGGIIDRHRQESARYLAYGITTVVDPATVSDPAFPIAELIEAGEIVGPRTFSSGEPLYGFGPTSDLHSLRDARDHVRRLVEWGAAVIKDYHQPSRLERQMLAQAAREAGVTTTAEGEDLFHDLAFIIDGHPGFEHNLPYAPLYADAVQFFGQAHIQYSPTLTVSSPQLRAQEYWLVRSDLWSDPKQARWVPWRELALSRYDMRRPLAEYAVPMLADGLADIVRAGARGALGGHGEWPGIDAHWDLWSGALALSPMEELELATWQGASYYGLDHDIGSVTIGKMADLVVLDANPLEDITNTRRIHLVMKGGWLYDGETLDAVWPEHRRYGPRPWVNLDELRSDVKALGVWDK